MTRFVARGAALLVGLAALLAQPIAASAQRSDCILDNCADRRGAQQGRGGYGGAYRNDRYDRTDRNSSSYGSHPRGASRPGDFDFYVLSLSWSPGFCATGGAERNRGQCARGAGMGFVVHGLWPQYERGFPQDCDPNRQPSRIALEQAQGLFPDDGLARYEWRKHGTCSGKSPADYFSDVRRARESIVIPPQFEHPQGDRTMSPQAVLRAFETANPRLRPGMDAVGCRGGVLQEVRFCMSKDLRDFRPCPEVARSSCRTRDLDVPAPR